MKGRECEYVVVDRVEAVENQADRHRIGPRLQDLAHHLGREAPHSLRPVEEVLVVQPLHADLHHLHRALLQQTLDELRTL